jgi:hypothetical protein
MFSMGQTAKKGVTAFMVELFLEFSEPLGVVFPEKNVHPI